MHDHREWRLCKHARERGTVAYVRFDELKVFALEVRRDVCALERRLVEIVEIIHDRHAPTPFGEQTLTQMRPDEARAAGDEYVSFIHQKSAECFDIPNG